MSNQSSKHYLFLFTFSFLTSQQNAETTDEENHGKNFISKYLCICTTACWWHGLVALHRARLILGWVTICGQVNHLGM